MREGFVVKHALIKHAATVSNENAGFVERPLKLYQRMSRVEEDAIAVKSAVIKAHQRRVTCTCIVCGKSFELEQSRIDDGRGRFCSQACALRYSGETSIEKLVREELERRGEPFEQQVKLQRFHIDFVLPRRKAVVECDGSYWHSYLNVVARDRRKDDYLTSLGYRVFRFTDREIRKSPSDCIDRVLGTVDRS
jgi:very-short-patch-repair endonuclease